MSSAYNPNDQHTLLYFYDLPKDIISSVFLATKIKDITGIEIDIVPQIRRDPNRHFFTAVVKFNDVEKFKIA